MKIYNYEKEYWLISDVAEKYKEKIGLKFKNNRFVYVESYKNFKESNEVSPHEYIFNLSKKTNIIYRMHNNIKKALAGEIEIGYTNRIILTYVIKEFEETFKEILERFDVEFLTLERKEND